MRLYCLRTLINIVQYLQQEEWRAIARDKLYKRLLFFTSFFHTPDSMPPSLSRLFVGASSPNSSRISGSPFSICDRRSVSPCRTRRSKVTYSSLVSRSSSNILQPTQNVRPLRQVKQRSPEPLRRQRPYRHDVSDGELVAGKPFALCQARIHSVQSGIQSRLAELPCQLVRGWPHASSHLRLQSGVAPVEPEQILGIVGLAGLDA